jgi:hypothetical protein
MRTPIELPRPSSHIIRGSAPERRACVQAVGASTNAATTTATAASPATNAFRIPMTSRDAFNVASLREPSLVERRLQSSRL